MDDFLQEGERPAGGTFEVGTRGAGRPAPRCARSTSSAARSPIMTQGAIVLPVVTAGMTEASATRKPRTP